MKQTVAPADARAHLRGLYQKFDGFEIPRRDARAVARSKGSSTYGELMPTATIRLLDRLGLEPADVFADLGAGTGKVVLLAAMTTRVGKALGIELSATRAEIAERALAEGRTLKLPGTQQVELRRADMLRTDLDEVTVAYTCSTAFSEAFMARLVRRLAELPALRKVASLQSFDEHPGFDLVEVCCLDATWKRQTQVHIYERVSGQDSVLPSSSATGLGW